MTPDCPTGKTVYGTLRRARLEAVKRIGQSRGADRTEPYGCDLCGMWHLRRKEGP